MRVKPLLGELLGTCILSFIGCSSVALAVLFEIFSSIVPIAFIWGTGVTLAIYATKKYSNIQAKLISFSPVSDFELRCFFMFTPFI